MENEYVKLWVKYEAYFKEFSDAEVGRLARAMMTYKSSGVEPKFSGNERYIWPAIKQDIDYASAVQQELSQTRSDSGKLGGRPKKPNAFSEKQKNQMLFEESKKSYCKGQGQGQGQGQGNIACSLSREQADAREAGLLDEIDFSIPDGWDEQRIIAEIRRCRETGERMPDWLRNWKVEHGPVW